MTTTDGKILNYGFRLKMQCSKAMQLLYKDMIALFISYLSKTVPHEIDMHISYGHSCLFQPDLSYEWQFHQTINILMA